MWRPPANAAANWPAPPVSWPAPLQNGARRSSRPLGSARASVVPSWRRCCGNAAATSPTLPASAAANSARRRVTAGWNWPKLLVTAAATWANGPATADSIWPKRPGSAAPIWVNGPATADSNWPKRPATAAATSPTQPWDAARITPRLRGPAAANWPRADASKLAAAGANRTVGAGHLRVAAPAAPQVAGPGHRDHREGQDLHRRHRVGRIQHAGDVVGDEALRGQWRHAGVVTGPALQPGQRASDISGGAGDPPDDRSHMQSD